MVAAPSDALIELLAPDGYYKYLDILKPVDVVTSHNETVPLHTHPFAAATIDEELVRKNYRKLSRKHHPDKPGGDADTFRLLNRAQRVLLNPRLRQQYDILGIDLDDDEEPAESLNTNDVDPVKDSSAGSDQSTGTQGIIQEIASLALTSIMQLAVRTVLMGAVAVIVVRFLITLVPALCFLTFIGYRIYQRTRIELDDCTICTRWEVLSPVSIALGLVCMYFGRKNNTSWLFWLGETAVIGVFTFNSAAVIPRNALTSTAIVVFSILSALWFRGNVWNYGIVVVLEAVLGLLVALAFPVIEFILEAILHEKLRKVGDRVRMHHETLQRYYEAQLKNLKVEKMPSATVKR